MVYDAGKAFKRIEQELIDSMMINMKNHRLEEDATGLEWKQWQAVQLQELEKYKRRNAKRYPKQFDKINDNIKNAIIKAKATGKMQEEIAILEAVKKGFVTPKRPKNLSGSFFRVNERKMNALLEAVEHDMKKAEYAVLRHVDDQYRQIIFQSQVYANSGAGTYEKAVDMASKDFLQRGINCVEYKNGARVNIADYASMAIRTSTKRAYLQGEGEKRNEWGISTVIMNKRGNACPKCIPFEGKILIDDVWSGGSADDGPYPLMSAAISAGLYHPNCKDVHSTYFPGVSSEPEKTFTKKELEDVEERQRLENKAQHAKRQEQRFARLSQFSLDEDNVQKYTFRRKKWTNARDDAERSLESFEEEKGFDLRRLYRNKDRTKRRPINIVRQNKLTREFRKRGGIIWQDDEAERYLRSQKAAAMNLNADTIVLQKRPTISEVLEELYHAEQYRREVLDPNDEVSRIKAEIEAQNYLLSVEKRYNIPREETRQTKENLKFWESKLKEVLD